MVFAFTLILHYLLCVVDSHIFYLTHLISYPSLTIDEYLSPYAGLSPHPRSSAPCVGSSPGVSLPSTGSLSSGKGGQLIWGFGKINYLCVTDPLALSPLASGVKLPAEMTLLYSDVMELGCLPQTSGRWVISLFNFRFHYLKDILPRDISHIV